MSISREARSRSIERERFPEGSAASARAERADAQRTERPEQPAAQVDADQTLAVRLGPAPRLPLVRNADDVQAEALNQRARIRGVGAVLDEPTERAKNASQDRAARADARRDPLTATPGSPEESEADEKQMEFPPLLGEGRADGEPMPPPRPSLPRPERDIELRGLPPRAEHKPQQPEPEEIMVEVLGAPSDSAAARADLRDEAPKLAPAAAPVARPGGEARPETPAENVEPLGRKVADRVLTKAGNVAAKAADDVVTRFLANVPTKDPGPEPRVRIDRISER